MNKEQAIYLRNIMKSYQCNLDKINEFNDKFLGEKGLFNENNEYRIKNKFYNRNKTFNNIEIEERSIM